MLARVSSLASHSRRPGVRAWRLVLLAWLATSLVAPGLASAAPPSNASPTPTASGTPAPKPKPGNKKPACPPGQYHIPEHMKFSSSEPDCISPDQMEGPNLNSDSSGFAGLMRSGLNVVLKALFGTSQGGISGALLSWLAVVPKFKEQTDLHQVRASVDAISFALLGLVLTASMLRFWISGLAGGGASALTGVLRTAGAALAILAWPWVFESGATVANDLTFVLLHSGGTLDGTAKMIGEAFTLSLVGVLFGSWFITIVVIVLVVLLLCALIAMKIVLIGGLAFVYVAMPLALVLWPLPGFDWLAPAASKAACVMFIWSTIWVLEFKATVALDQGAFSGPTVLDKLLGPLVVIVMLVFCIKLPLMFTRLAMSGLGGGGSSFFGKYAALQAIRGGALGAKAAGLLGGAGANRTPFDRAGAAPGAAAPLSDGSGLPVTSAAPPKPATAARRVADRMDAGGIVRPADPDGPRFSRGDGAPEWATEANGNAATVSDGANGGGRMPDLGEVEGRRRALAAEFEANASSSERTGPAGRQRVTRAMSALQAGGQATYAVNAHNHNTMPRVASTRAALAERDGDTAMFNAWTDLGSAPKPVMRHGVAAWWDGQPKPASGSAGGSAGARPPRPTAAPKPAPPPRKTR